MKFRPPRAIREFQQRIADAFDAMHIGIRRGIALLIALAFVGGMVFAQVAGSIDFAHAREAVWTEERRTAVLVDIEYRGRAGTFHIIRVNGQERELDYGWFLPDETLGTKVSYVIDPDDPEHLIAVGTPEDWEDMPRWLSILLMVGGIMFGLLFAAMAAGRLIPEDVEAVEERLPEIPWAKRFRRRPRHKKRRSGGTGRHSW